MSRQDLDARYVRPALRLASSWPFALLAMANCAFALQPVAPRWARDGIPSVADYVADGTVAQENARTIASSLHVNEAHSLEVAGTRFEIALRDGSVLSQDALIGMVLSVTDDVGGRADIRIDGIVPDPQDASGEITLYALSVREDGDVWHDLCTPGPDGLALGFPVSGIWTASGTHEQVPGAFSLTCTSGAIGKCVRMGYRYWQTEASGAPMWALHQACTRMLRADYCGDGSPHTRDGTLVNVYDRFGIQQADPEPSREEATWDADGARCVIRTRVPEVATLEEIARRCPERLATRSGRLCAQHELGSDPRALLANRS